MSNGASRAEYVVRVETGCLVTGDGSLTETRHMVSFPKETAWSAEDVSINFCVEEYVGSAVVRHDGEIVAYLSVPSGLKHLGQFKTAEEGVEVVIDFSRAVQEAALAGA